MISRFSLARSPRPAWSLLPLLLVTDGEHLPSHEGIVAVAMELVAGVVAGGEPELVTDGAEESDGLAVYR